MVATKTNIPTGDSKEDVYVRRVIIVESLYPLNGKSVPCGAFKGKKVEFLFNSIDETAARTARRYESTLAALRVVEALKISSLVKTDEPHSNKQRKMEFTKVHELSAFLENIGEVKIIIGERRNKRIIHYCITKKKE